MRFVQFKQNISQHQGNKYQRDVQSSQNLQRKSILVNLLMCKNQRIVKSSQQKPKLSQFQSTFTVFMSTFNQIIKINQSTQTKAKSVSVNSQIINVQFNQNIQRILESSQHKPKLSQFQSTFNMFMSNFNRIIVKSSQHKPKLSQFQKKTKESN